MQNKKTLPISVYDSGKCQVTGQNLVWDTRHCGLSKSCGTDEVQNKGWPCLEGSRTYITVFICVKHIVSWEGGP